MSILGNLVSRILGPRAGRDTSFTPGRVAPSRPATAPTTTAAPAPGAARSPATPEPGTPVASGSAAAAPPQGGAAPLSAGVGERAASEAVDVAGQLDRLAAQQRQKLDWRHSIVDLMKLVGMDSTLAERRELAQELGYDGDPRDTARMNLWLHEQVLRKLAEDGGKVPRDLLH